MPTSSTRGSASPTPTSAGARSVGIDLVGDLLGPGCAASTNPKGGHGTHVAGTIGGSAYGVAKNVSLVSVRVLNCAGSGTFSQVINGIEWVTDNAIRPAVANMSLGGGLSPALDDAVSASIASGVTYAVAAGNENENACNSSPADVAQAITVGATTTTDSRDTSYSNFGPCLDLFAPGTSITSAWNTGDTATKAVSGTSMASPHVAGAAAQYLGRNPAADPAAVTYSILVNATLNIVTNQGTGSPRSLLYENYLPPVAPNAPALAATPGNTTAHLSWTIVNDGGSPLTAVKVYRSTTSGGETLRTTLAPSATTFDDSGLANGTTYFYEVSAVNALGETFSTEVSVLPAGPPAAPGSFSATPADARVDLSWSAPADGGSPILGYRIYRGTTPGGQGPTPLLTTGAATTTASDTSAVNGTTYYYKVAAYNAVGETASIEKSAKPVGPPATPVLTAVGHVDGIHLSWTVPSDGGAAITGYRVYRGTTSGGEVLYQTLGSGVTSYDDPAPEGSMFFYQVSATNAKGESVKSVERVATAGASIDVFGRNAGSGLSWQHVAGSIPQPTVPLGGSVTSNPTAVSDATGTATFVRGPDGALWWQRITPGGASGWLSLGGYLNSDPVAYSTGSEIGVFVLGGDNAIYWMRISGTVAGGTPQGYVSLGGSGTSTPVTTSVGSTKFVVVRGTTGAVFYQRFSGSTPTGGWLPLGGYITSDPSVTADNFGGGGVTVFARGADLSEFRQHISTSGTAGGWLALGGNITSTAGAASDGTNTFVFVRGADTSVFYQKFTSATAGTGWLPLGGVATSDPKAVFDGSQVRVVVRSTDNGYHWLIPTVVGWTPLGGTYTSNPAVAAAS